MIERNANIALISSHTEARAMQLASDLTRHQWLDAHVFWLGGSSATLDFKRTS